jgi:hypothetical protein
LLQRLQALVGFLLGHLVDLGTADEQAPLLQTFEDARCLLGADVARYDEAIGERVDDRMRTRRRPRAPPGDP